MLRHPCYALVNQIKSFRISNPNLQWVHVLRDANQVEDRLAKFGLSLEEQFRMFEDCPPFLDLTLFTDRVSVSFSRGFYLASVWALSPILS